MSQHIKIITFVLSSIVLIVFFPFIAHACTYNATITGNHLDFSITSDLDKLAVIQFVRTSGSFLVTKMYGPYMGLPWTYFDDPSCNVYVNYPVGCRQNRGGGLGTGAFWQWTDDGYTNYRILPGGTWGLDFNSPPTYESIQIGYGTSRPNQEWFFCNRIDSSPTPSPSPSPTPIPTATPTPTPSPTSTPLPTTTLKPVTKTVFVPGLGASWNANAFVNCTPDPEPSHWSLAPYAEVIYNPILQAITQSNWTLFPFYYDWRQEIQSNSSVLSSSINNFSGGEKVNIIGHSMGGLVAADYLTNYDQGIKTNSLLIAGSPLKGAVLSYPPWAGGSIWDDNFITKVALTLYLKHCGGLFTSNLTAIRNNVPSLRNLLPTFDYLAYGKTKSLKPISTMHDINKSNWSVNLANLYGVRFKTLTGTGYNTLSQIQTKAASAKDISGGLWLDGKPASKVYSTSGDGTVLLSSAKIDDAHNITINQTHHGLVDSIEGMSKILEFLGTPTSLSNLTNLNPKAPETNSALVIIGYPSSFWITDQEGQTKRDSDGMVAFINPGQGLYKLNLLPKANNTLLIVAQFLPNGDVKYKEYNLRGTDPKFKTLQFNLVNPKEDILTP